MLKVINVSHYLESPAFAWVSINLGAAIDGELSNRVYQRPAIGGK